MSADQESSYGLTTFSPNGRLPQIEYANNAVKKGSTSLGIKATNGAVLVAEKKTVSPLVDASTMQKVYQLDDHAGVTYSGIGPDARVLVDAARKECQTYRQTYGDGMPIGQLVRAVGNVYQEFTQQGGVRPFGCSLLIAGADAMGTHLYQAVPLGTFICWKAAAIGKNGESARTFLEKRYTDDIELEDAIHTGLLTLKEGFDGRMTNENTELGRVVNGKFEVINTDQLRDYLDQI